MISFLTFAYNEGKFIEETIKSVLCIEDDIEYILVDDHSTDETWDIMQKYALADNRVKAYKNAGKGKNAAANFGMTKCIGEWVMIVGGDDLLESGNYELFKSKMELCDPREMQVFVGGLVKRFSDNPRYSCENGVMNSFPRKNEKKACTNGFASRKAVDLIYPIPEQYPNEDSWTSMYYYFLCDKLINIPEVVLHYRIHDNNSINHNDRDFKRFSEALHVRNNQQLDFIEKYGSLLKEEDIRYLKNQYKAEDCRYRKKYIRLLFCRISVSEKLRLLLNSNKLLKSFKYRITRAAQKKY